jgi:hypothetical protein
MWRADGHTVKTTNTFMSNGGPVRRSVAKLLRLISPMRRAARVRIPGREVFILLLLFLLLVLPRGR